VILLVHRQIKRRESPPAAFFSKIIRPIVRFADHPVDRRRPVGRHLVFRGHAVGVHVPVSRDLAAGHLVVREHQVYLVRLDSVVLPYYLSLLYY